MRHCFSRMELIKEGTLPKVIGQELSKERVLIPSIEELLALCARIQASLAFSGNLYFAIHSSSIGMQTEEMRQVEDVRMRAQPKVIIGISAYNIEGSIERIINSLNVI